MIETQLPKPNAYWVEYWLCSNIMQRVMYVCVCLRYLTFQINNMNPFYNLISDPKIHGIIWSPRVSVRQDVEVEIVRVYLKLLFSLSQSWRGLTEGAGPHTNQSTISLSSQSVISHSNRRVISHSNHRVISLSNVMNSVKWLYLFIVLIWS